MEAKGYTTKFKLEQVVSYSQSSHKSKYSCMECRKSKKKCSKDLTGCLKCARLKRRCIYPDRKPRLMAQEQQIDAPPIHSGEPVITENSNANHSSFIVSDHPKVVPKGENNFLLQTLGFSHLILNKVNVYSRPRMSKNLAGKFVEAFFKHNHRSYPFICQSEFLSEFEQMNNLSDTITTYFEFQLHMIMAIGCTTLSRVGLLEPEDNYSKYFSYKSIGFISQGPNISELETLKMLLLLCIYSFFEPQGLHSWNIFGLISRSAINLGLNKWYRDPRDSTLDQEMRNRLFWSIYNMDRLLSVSLGRPLSIDESNIDVPLPVKLDDEEQFTFKTILSIIKLRKIEGEIIKKLYSLKAREIYSQSEVESIKLQLEGWMNDNQPNLPENLKFFSFHGSSSWYFTRLYHNLMLLYRPSYLVPKPEMNQLSELGQYCLKTLSYTHKLFKSSLLPLNWITLYRFLAVCSTTLYCLCNWSIDLNDSKADILLSIEILNAFSENWVFASKCSNVFQNIVDNILEISLSTSANEVNHMKQLSSDLIGASSAYHEILNDNSINMSFTTMVYEDLMTPIQQDTQQDNQQQSS